MKYLGVDYGSKKVGLAISDDEGSFAFAHSIVPEKEAVEQIEKIADEKQINTVVVGESQASNGLHNNLFKETKKFALKLEKKGLKVIFIPEMFSSVEAHRFQVKKGDRDDSAAAIILQRYLDKQIDKENR